MTNYSSSVTIHMNPQLEREVAQALEPTMLRAAVFCHAHASRNVPVETGNLLRSGTYGVEWLSEGGVRMPVGYVAFTAPYAIFVELGTRYMAAQPYLRPALLALRAWMATGGR